MDENVHFERTGREHVVVICGGNYYHMPVTDDHGKYISSLDLENQFEWIKADAKHSDGKLYLMRVKLIDRNLKENF